MPLFTRELQNGTFELRKPNEGKGETWIRAGLRDLPARQAESDELSTAS
jgi:hypothetical protein